MKTFILFTGLIISLSAISQPYIGLQAGNKGVAAEFGFLANKIEIAVAAKTPLSNTDVPTLLSITVGKQFLLTQKEEDNYSFTTSIGFANYRVSDFTAYNADPTGQAGIVKISAIKPFYGMELGKDAYLGRVYIKAQYCGGAYYSLGMKMFFNRN
jgi:hypothetical protein